MIAFYVNTENLANSIKINNYIKILQPQAKTIAYGEMPLYLPDFFKKTKFDFIVSRECDQEIVISDLYLYAVGKIKNIDIRGGYMISDGKLLKCKPGEYSSPEKWGFSNLKKLPLIDYFKMQNKEQVVLTISRGCPYNCCYCNAVSYYGVSERRRPIEDIINFINSNEYIYYKFFAPNFTLNEKETFKLCEALIKNEKKIKWSCTTRPDLLKNELLIKKMSQAGCYKIAVGIESIEESDLLNIKKQYDLNNMIQGINLLKKYNIEYKALIMFGVPNQTKTGIEYTLDFL